MYSQLTDMISQLMYWYGRLISGLTVSFSRFVSNFELNSSFLSSRDNSYWWSLHRNRRVLWSI